MPKQKIKNDKFKIAVFPRKGVRSLYSSVEVPVMGMERRGRRSSMSNSESMPRPQLSGISNENEDDKFNRMRISKMKGAKPRTLRGRVREIRTHGSARVLPSALTRVRG